MKNVPEILSELKERIKSEEEMLQDIRKDGCMNTVGGGMSMGALEALRNFQDFILEKED